MRFRFELRPLADVRPWGGEKPSLHWFGLTDGWYWIEVGGHQLLRYSDRTLHRWAAKFGAERAFPYADYYVARLWEDVLEMVPTVLEPIPDDLVSFVTRDRDDWPRGDRTPQAETAEQWHAERSIYLGPLRNPPHIRWWRTITEDGDLVTVDWMHRPDAEIEFSCPLMGRVEVPTSVFVDAVTAFDRALLAAMDQRIHALETTGPPAGVTVDLDALRQEQQERALWLGRARACEVVTDADAVRLGVRELLGGGWSGPAG
ncbi:DUF5984 family protein [Streptomyces sp. NPDC059256]|uniref:DUF5984 family protein n=1 Tax=Streptomyces sp. NPDC059256 TaxID=3346794 RepID=UPI00367B36A5